MFSEKVTMNGGVAKVCQDPRKMNNVFEKMPRKFSKTADVWRLSVKAILGSRNTKKIKLEEIRFFYVQRVY